MNLNRSIRTLALVLVTMALTLPAAAQTAVNSTTLAAAVASASDNQVRLTSTTTVAANDVLYVDSEAMLVRAVNSPYVTVARGIDGTAGALHTTLSTVYTGPRIRFAQSTPVRGSCTRTSETYLPRIVPSRGEVWDCLAGAGVWIKTNGGSAMVVTCRALLIADMVDQSCFTADRPYYLTKITEVHKVAEAGGTLTLIPRRQTTTQAAASGDALATAIDMVTTGNAAQTVKTATLTTTGSLLIINPGNRLGLDFTDDTAGELADVLVTFTLIPQ